jgi:hypothetical protein
LQDLCWYFPAGLDLARLLSSSDINCCPTVGMNLNQSPEPTAVAACVRGGGEKFAALLLCQRSVSGGCGSAPRSVKT